MVILYVCIYLGNDVCGYILEILSVRKYAAPPPRRCIRGRVRRQSSAAGYINRVLFIITYPVPLQTAAAAAAS